MNGIYLALPVWGRAHVERMLNYALPSLLAEGNIPALRRRGIDVTALIYTNSEDAYSFRRHDVLTNLRAVCGVEIIKLGSNAETMGEQLHPGHRHGGTMMKVCHNYGLARAWAYRFGLCPLVADQFFSDGWGNNILACLGAGKYALMEAGYSLPPEFLGELDDCRSAGIISIAPNEASRRLLRLMRDHMPPTYDHHDDTRWALSWSTANGKGFLVRPQHTPIDFIVQKHGPVWCNRSTDNDLAHQALDSPDEIMLMTSTAAHFTGGIEGLGNSAPPKANSWTEAAAKCTNAELQAIWLKHACHPWHHRWMQTNWWCEDGSLTPVDKEPVERHADAVVARCFATLEELNRSEGQPEMLAAERELHTWW